MLISTSADRTTRKSWLHKQNEGAREEKEKGKVVQVERKVNVEVFNLKCTCVGTIARR